MGAAPAQQTNGPVVVLRVTVRAPDLDAFINRYSRHIAEDRIFIFSKTPQPVGTKVRFTLQLGNGEVLMQGRGTVQRTVPPPGDARHPPGMEVQFVPLDERSKTLVDFMLATKAGQAQEVEPPPPPSLPPPPKAAALVHALAPKAPLPPPPQPPPFEPMAASDSAPSLATLSLLPSGPSPPTPLPAGIAADATPPPTARRPDAPLVPPMADPANSAPLVFAESFSGDAPANPFSDVSDGAIEYFVEWSLEQSIGPRTLPQARFSEVPMTLPGAVTHPALDPEHRRRTVAVLGAVFAAGALVGGLVVGVARRAPASSASPPPAAAIVAPAPPTAAAPEPVEPSTAPAAKTAAGDVELVVVTRPAGASVAIDGAPAGTSPLTTKVAAGAHAVAVNKERYVAATSNVDAPGRVVVDLRRPTATLHVTSTPSAADVVIAGERRGRTPLEVRLPGFESYDVRVALAGARPWRKTVYLSHASNRVDASLAMAKPAGKKR